MVPIMDGAIAMGFAAAGLFFLRFWRETRDRLFLFFGLAFFIMAANRLGLALAFQYEVNQTALYWIRFQAYSLILIAVVDKNRSRKSRRADQSSAPST